MDICAVSSPLHRHRGDKASLDYPTPSGPLYARPSRAKKIAIPKEGQGFRKISAPAASFPANYPLGAAPCRAPVCSLGLRLVVVSNREPSVPYRLARNTPASSPCLPQQAQSVTTPPVIEPRGLGTGVPCRRPISQNPPVPPLFSVEKTEGAVLPIQRLHLKGASHLHGQKK